MLVFWKILRTYLIDGPQEKLFIFKHLKIFIIYHLNIYFYHLNKSTSMLLKTLSCIF